MKTPAQPKTYDCPFLGHAISGVAARGCNYCYLDTYRCGHNGEDCVAKEGMIEFAEKLDEGLVDIIQSQPKCTDRHNLKI